ncbi:hypothetical protein SAMN05216403_101130 [Nitrosospira multiformis ATCC 25196]|uniref:Uncharacterized protein n=1 Tax=Nitrosospira multiformis (strain ATCC 25196 / NCIMB 11849 / C 71) TaxID=323848 RepID=A0A1H5RQ27_NITMU|nr:hypothetical protein SAMN05216403_101130 [Nitrosospira multiformis ATCC 25196]
MIRLEELFTHTGRYIVCRAQSRLLMSNSARDCFTVSVIRHAAAGARKL